MSRLFNRLAKFEKWSPESYDACCQDTDKLFQLELALRKYGPEFGDESCAKMLVNSVEIALIAFREHIHSSKDRMLYLKSYTAISERLGKHLRNIIRRVRAHRYGFMTPAALRKAKFAAPAAAPAAPNTATTKPARKQDPMNRGVRAQ